MAKECQVPFDILGVVMEDHRDPPRRPRELVAGQLHRRRVHLVHDLHQPSHAVRVLYHNDRMER